MVWSFLWRLPLFALATAWFITFFMGFVMGVAGFSAQTILSVGYFFQAGGLLLGAFFAFVSAKRR